LLGLAVGCNTAEGMIKAAEGGSYKLLNRLMASCVASARHKAKLQVAKELVRRPLAESMRYRDLLSSPAMVRDYPTLTFENKLKFVCIRRIVAKLRFDGTSEMIGSSYAYEVRDS
jgi:hypothetical protein